MTMATASFSQRRAEGSVTGREGERRRRRTTRREGETRHSVVGRGGEGGQGGGGAPDLDLDLDLAEEEEEQQEAEVRRRRSRTVRQKQKEPGNRSMSSPRSSSPSWDSSPPGEGAESGGAGRERRRKSEKKSRRRAEEEKEEEREGSPAHHTRASGGSRASAQRSAFSFLQPMSQEPRPLSDSESAASFSEVSLSAASIATASWREDPDWRVGAESSADESGSPPGPWLKPSPQRLSQVLIGSRRSGQGIVGGLSI